MVNKSKNITGKLIYAQQIQIYSHQNADICSLISNMLSKIEYLCQQIRPEYIIRGKIKIQKR